MTKKLEELLLERKQLVDRCRAMHDKANAEKRSLTADETTNYEQAWSRVEEIGAIVEREEKLAALERSWQEPAPGQPRIAELSTPSGELPLGESRMVGSVPVPHDEFDTPEYGRHFRNYLRGGRDGTPQEDLVALRAAQQRALAMQVDTQGGYIVPREWAAKLIIARDNAVFIRQRATKLTLATGQSMGCPSLDADPADADWTTELAIGGEDSTMAFGGRELFPKPLGKLLKVSRTLIRQSPLDVDALVRGRLAYKFAVSEENAYLNGSGAAGVPLGMFTASDLGISTGRDVSTDNTSTEITADGLLEAKYTLKGAYWPNAAWIFHRGGVKRIAKLKDGEGRYIWQPSVTAGQPALLFDFPLFVSEYAPNTWTASCYVGLLGDISFYWIVDALSMSVQALLELYAGTNQTGYIGRLEVDAMPVLEEAFVRVKLAA